MPFYGFEPDIIKVNAVQAFPCCYGVTSDLQCPGSFLSANCSSSVLEMCMRMRSQLSLASSAIVWILGIQKLIFWSWPVLLLICLGSSITCHMCLTFFSCLGKYQSGVDKPDPKTWKANFRCAMNSLPDIEEVKDKSIKKGNNAFRVYRMLPLSERPSKKGRRESFVNMKCCWGHCVEKITCCR